MRLVMMRPAATARVRWFYTEIVGGRRNKICTAVRRAGPAGLLREPRPTGLLPAGLLREARPAGLLREPRPTGLLREARPTGLLRAPRPAGLCASLDPRGRGVVVVRDDQADAASSAVSSVS